MRLSTNDLLASHSLLFILFERRSGFLRSTTFSLDVHSLSKSTASASLNALKRNSLSPMCWPASLLKSRCAGTSKRVRGCLKVRVRSQCLSHMQSIHRRYIQTQVRPIRRFDRHVHGYQIADLNSPERSAQSGRASSVYNPSVHSLKRSLILDTGCTHSLFSTEQARKVV